MKTKVKLKRKKNHRKLRNLGKNQSQKSKTLGSHSLKVSIEKNRTDNRLKRKRRKISLT